MGSSKSSIGPAIELISHWHLNLKKKIIFDSGPLEIVQYFEAVDQILQSAQCNEHQEFISIPSKDKEEFISMIVSRFKSEFRTMLTHLTETAMSFFSFTELSTTSITVSTSYEDYALYDAPKSFVVVYLRRIVERTNACGHLRVLTDMYISMRKQFLDQIIKKLRYEELLGGKTKKLWGEDLKIKTVLWINAITKCFKGLFVREKQIAKQIFGGLENSIADECFMHIAKDVIFGLLMYAENVISSNLASEKLEIVLIMYNALVSLLPDVNALFQFELGQGPRNCIENIQIGLQNEVKRMLKDFVNGVFNDASKIVHKDEAVLHFTKYVMGYLNLIVNHKKLLMNVIVSRPRTNFGSLNFRDDVLPGQGNISLSPLSLHLVLIIAVLVLNLEAKGEKFKNENPLFGYELFMMNNIQFIVHTISESKGLQEMVGHDYLKKLKNKLNNSMDQFRALTCDELMHCLKEDDLYISCCFYRGVSTRALSKKIKKFNNIYEKMYAVQSRWIIQDTKTREMLCCSTKKMLVPAYETFLEKFKNHLNCENNRKSSILFFKKVSIKYSVEDLSDLVMKRYQLASSTKVRYESVHV